MWTEQDLDSLECKEQFDAMPHYSGKADVARYEILHRHGGIYMDADSECVKTLDDDFLDNIGFAAWENEYARPGLVANGVIGTLPGCSLMSTLIASVKGGDLGKLRALPATEVWRTTGPGLLSAAIQGRLGARPATQYRIYPSAHFYPQHFTGLSYSGTGVEIYARQHWASTVGLTPLTGRTTSSS